MSDWANIAEILAAIGVIVSLIFVGLELRNNTEATESATREAVNQKDLNYLSLRLDSSVLATATAKFDSGEELSPLEISQLVHQEFVNFIIFEHSYYQYRKGVLEDSEWERHRNFVQTQIQNYPFSRTMWERRRSAFTPEFQDLVGKYYVVQAGQ